MREDTPILCYMYLVEDSIELKFARKGDKTAMFTYGMTVDGAYAFIDGLRRCIASMEGTEYSIDEIAELEKMLEATPDLEDE